MILSARDKSPFWGFFFGLEKAMMGERTKSIRLWANELAAVYNDEIYR